MDTTTQVLEQATQLTDQATQFSQIMITQILVY